MKNLKIKMDFYMFIMEKCKLLEVDSMYYPLFVNKIVFIEFI
jgi:hypothetical protein